MKPENTIENKEIFFALYLNQHIERYPGWEEDFYPEDTGIKRTGHRVYGAIGEDAYLALTPLSAITDEDAYEAVYMHWGHNRGQKVDVNWAKGIAGTIAIQRDVADYLRSRGYALPWMGLSVDDLVKRGWVKLKEEVEK